MRIFFNLVLFLLFVGFTKAQNFTPNIWTVDTGPTDKVNVTGMTFFHSLSEDNSIWSADSTKPSNTQTNPVLESSTNDVGGQSSIYNFGPPDPSTAMLPTEDEKPPGAFDLIRDPIPARDNTWSNTITSATQTNTRPDTQTNTPVDLSTLGIQDFNTDRPSIELPGVSDEVSNRTPTLSLSGKFVDQSNRPIFRVKTKFIDESNNRKPGFKAKSAFVDSSNSQSVSPSRSLSTTKQGREFGSVLSSGKQQDNKVSYLTPGNGQSDTDTNINFRDLAANTPRNVGQYTTTIETATGAPVDNNDNFITTPPSNIPQSTDLQIESLYPKAPFPINSNINIPSGSQVGNSNNENNQNNILDFGSSSQDIPDTLHQNEFHPSPIPTSDQELRPSGNVPRVTQLRDKTQTIDHFETEPNVQVINQFGDDGIEIPAVIRNAAGSELTITNGLQDANNNFANRNFDQTRNAFNNGNAEVPGRNSQLSRKGLGTRNVINGNNRDSQLRPLEQGNQLGTVQNLNNPGVSNGFTNGGAQSVDIDTVNNRQAGIQGIRDMNIGRSLPNDFMNEQTVNRGGFVLGNVKSGNQMNIPPFQNQPPDVMNDTPRKTQPVIDNPTSNQFGIFQQNSFNNAVPVVNNQESTMSNSRDLNQNSIFETNLTPIQQDPMRRSTIPGVRNMVTNQANTPRSNGNAVNPNNNIVRPGSNNNMVNPNANINTIRSSTRDSINIPSSNNIVPRTGASNNMVSPNLNNNILRAGTNNNMANPTTNDNMVRPSTSNNVARPITNSNMLRPSTNNNMLRPSTNNNILRPSTDNNALMLVTSNNMFGPSTNNNMVRPGTNNNMVRQRAGSNMVRPSTNNNMMRPVTSNNMLRPSRNINIVKPSINNDMMRPGANNNMGNQNTNDNMVRSSNSNNMGRPSTNNNLANPSTNNNMVKPNTDINIVRQGTNSNIVRPSTNNNMVRPGTIDNTVNPDTNNNMMEPGTNNNMVNPNTNDNIVRSSTSNNMDRPSTNINMVNPSTNNNIISPSTNNNMVNPATNNNLVRSGTDINLLRPNTNNNVVSPNTNNNVVRPMFNADSQRSPLQTSGFKSRTSGVNPVQSMGQNRLLTTQNQFNQIPASINNGQNFQSLSPNVPINNFNNNPSTNFRNFQNGFQRPGFIQDNQLPQNGQNDFRSLQNNNFQTPSNFGTFQNIRPNRFSNTFPNRNFQPGQSNFQTPRFSSMNEFNPQQSAFGLQNRQQFIPGNSFQTNRQFRPFG